MSAGRSAGMSLPARTTTRCGRIAASMRRPRSPPGWATRSVEGGTKRDHSARAPRGVVASSVRQRRSRAMGRAVAASVAV